MGRTPKVVEDRSEQIMDAALRVFAQKGFARATIKDIGREAGVTSGLIYHYFESKEALLKAIFESRTPLQLIHSVPEQMLELPTERFLHMFLKNMLDIVESEKFMQVLRVYLPEAIYNIGSAQFGVPAIREATRFMENYLAAKMESGELRKTDAALTTHLLLGCMMDFALRRQVLKDPETLRYSHEEIVDGLVDMAMNGLVV